MKYVSFDDSVSLTEGFTGLSRITSGRVDALEEAIHAK
jgi:hypothetical protein